MTDLIRWDPFRGSMTLHDVMERAFDESFVRSFAPWLLQEGERRSLAVDMYETDDSLEVKASLPGIKPEDVDISVVGNTLRIKGETKVEEEREETGKYHYRERHYGVFQRAITLPMEVNTEEVEAVIQDGVLKLTFPKVEESKAKRIEIKAE